MQGTEQSNSTLDPQDRISEVLFGLIMVLTFTGSLSVAEAGREEIKTMLIGALGCNLAWGFIDAVMYLMAQLGDHGRGIRAFRSVRKTSDPAEAHRIIAASMPPLIASLIKPPEMEDIRQKLNQMSEPPQYPHLTRDDYRGALYVFLLVFLCTFPVVIPFLFMHDARTALRVSNAIAIAMLFLTGYAFGRVAGYQPWRMGLAMVFVGVILVAVTIALGG